MPKFFVLCALCLPVLAGCRQNKPNTITIEIYQTEHPDVVYDGLALCDSLLKAALPVIIPDSTSLTSMAEAGSVRAPSVFSMLYNVLYPHQVSFVFVHDKQDVRLSHAFIGEAKPADTGTINQLLVGKDCAASQLAFKYKWIPEPDDTEAVWLAGIKNNQPVAVFHAGDVDSITLTPAPTLTGIIDEMFGNTGKKAPSAYALNIVLKQASARLMKQVYNRDKMAGYYMVIRSGSYMNIIPLKNPLMEGNTLHMLKTIDREELSEFKNKLDVNTYVME